MFNVQHHTAVDKCSFFPGIPNPIEDKDLNEKKISALADFINENRNGYVQPFVAHVLCDICYIGLDALFVYFMDTATNGFMFKGEFLQVNNVFQHDTAVEKYVLNVFFIFVFFSKQYFHEKKLFTGL